MARVRVGHTARQPLTVHHQQNAGENRQRYDIPQNNRANGLQGAEHQPHHRHGDENHGHSARHRPDARAPVLRPAEGLFLCVVHVVSSRCDDGVFRRDDAVHARVVGLRRHGVQQRKIVAYANADSPRLRKVSIVVSAAPSQTVALPVKRRAGHENQVHVVRFNRRTGFVRLPNAVCAPAQVGRPRHPIRAHHAFPLASGQSQRLSGFKRVAQHRVQSQFAPNGHISHHDPRLCGHASSDRIRAAAACAASCCAASLSARRACRIRARSSPLFMR